MAVHLWLALALSTLAGVSLGLLGGGGSILAVPILVYVARLDAHQAIGVALAIVGTTALVGGLAHARSGQADARAAVAFGLASALAAPVGALATPLFPGRVLLLLFGALMVVVGGLMLRGRRGKAEAARGERRGLALLGAGLATGLVTGFLGVGGGFLIVPALTLLGGLRVHVAVGTSLLVIAATSAAGLAGHLHRGDLPLGLTAAFAAASVSGVLLGQRIAGRFDPARLRRSFALFVILVGLLLVAANARAGAGSGDRGQRPQDVGLGPRADHARDLVTLLEDDQRRHALDPQARGGDRAPVDVQLGDAHPAGEARREVLDHRLEAPARHAPGRPDIEQHR